MLLEFLIGFVRFGRLLTVNSKPGGNPVEAPIAPQMYGLAVEENPRSC